MSRQKCALTDGSLSFCVELITTGCVVLSLTSLDRGSC
jgi:hypothetical protein